MGREGVCRLSRTGLRMGFSVGGLWSRAERAWGLRIWCLGFSYWGLYGDNGQEKETTIVGLYRV